MFPLAFSSPTRTTTSARRFRRSRIWLSMASICRRNSSIPICALFRLPVHILKPGHYREESEAASRVFSLGLDGAICLLGGRDEGLEFLGRGEIRNILETEVFQERPRGAVEKRPAYLSLTPEDPDEPPFHEGFQDGIHQHAPDRLDLGFGDRLPVGDDGQRLERRPGQPGRSRLGQSADPGVQLRSGRHPIAASDLKDREARTPLLIPILQGVQALNDPCLLLAQDRLQLLDRERIRGGEEDRLQDRWGVLATAAAPLIIISPNRTRCRTRTAPCRKSSSSARKVAITNERSTVGGNKASKVREPWSVTWSRMATIRSAVVTGRGTSVSAPWSSTRLRTSRKAARRSKRLTSSVPPPGGMSRGVERKKKSRCPSSRSAKVSAAARKRSYSRSISTRGVRGSSSPASPSAEGSTGSNILDLMYTNVAAMTRNSPATSRSSSWSRVRTWKYSSVIRAMGIS